MAEQNPRDEQSYQDNRNATRRDDQSVANDQGRATERRGLADRRKSDQPGDDINQLGDDSIDKDFGQSER